ncbi:MAG: hypothetical protein K9I74_04635 [Bacteroidales bacterium]|nr:hypothetical protein [Bacteroidales bacterium]
MHRRRALKYLSLILLLVITASCSQKIVFTAKLRNKLENENINLKDVQFYNSDKIKLKRTEEKPEELSVSSGAVKIEEGKIIEEIIIKKKTPGVCVEAKSYQLNISFENGNDKYLKFGRKTGGSLDNKFRLYAKKWKTQKGEIVYGDTLYTAPKDAANTYLMVEKDQVYELIREKRVAKGRTIEEDQ